jgi:hypothetical protein
MISGSYEHLIHRAKRLPASGIDVQVASVEDLPARLTVPRRAKDAARVNGLPALQRGG